MRLLVWIATFAFIVFVWRMVFALLGRIFSLLPPYAWAGFAGATALWLYLRRRRGRHIKVKSSVGDVYRGGGSSGTHQVIDTEGRITSEHTSGA